MSTSQNRRILLIDDMVAIHEAFRKVLVPRQSESIQLDAVEAMLFGDHPTSSASTFELDSAYQGQEGLAKVQSSLQAGRPYALAFVDMRMPPGWDGVQTIEQLWQVDPGLQIVICTAFSDSTWEEVLARLEVRDRLLILKKPFDPIEIYQLACALTAKWQMTRDAGLKMAQLEKAVEERTVELAAANDVLRREIAERTRNEAQLRLAASVFHNTLDSVMIIDPNRRMVSVNQAFVSLTGYSPEDAVGQPEAVLHSERQDAEFYKEMWITVERDGRWQGELWNRRRDGADFLIRMNLVKIADSAGQVECYVGVLHDITDMRRKEEHIRYLAFHDPLTGLPNRTLLQDRLEQAITAARRHDESLGLMFIDLDRFKSVNDSLGHDAGDGLLKEVAHRMTGSLRKVDTVARIGGDEFVVILKRVEMPQHYGQVAQMLIDTVSKPLILEGQPMQVGASIGIACFPEDGADAVELMKNADAAMYAAKAAGRGIYRFFQPAMTSLAVDRLKLEMQLRAAVPNGELELFYQPKVSLDTGLACGLEALVRWRHPTLGLVPPGEFIPMAEATGIIGALGDWVLEEVCRQLRAWRLADLGAIRIAVNVSARQLQQRDLAGHIAGLVQKYQISASDLEIELTESVLMANPEEISGALSRLRDIGVLVAVDDFGTGYSSLAYLRRLPIDVLKIDRSFVMNADQNDSDGQIVKLILGLGKALKLAIVAEGVETESQAQFLRSCGCTTAQGYLYARPQPAAQIEAWLKEHGGPVAPPY